MRQLIAGNWKMNGRMGSIDAYAKMLRAAPASLFSKADLLICPPAVLLYSLAADLAGSKIMLGVQDCSAHGDGAHTGDLSAAMLQECGAKFVILGHSERRVDHKESDALVRHKAIAAAQAGLTPIICVGENLIERDTLVAESVVRAQLQGSLPDGFAGLIAYEPIWAIGTGRTAECEDIQRMHEVIRAELKTLLGQGGADMRILYGGSVKPSNAEDILATPNVGGALVGGASLNAADLLTIAACARGG